LCLAQRIRRFKHFVEHAASLGIDLEITARTPEADRPAVGPDSSVRGSSTWWDSGTGASPRSRRVDAMTDLMARRLTGENTISWRDPTSLDQLRIPGRNNGRKRPLTGEGR
jgi:hypothetical protein